jgi:3-phenylpropionate/trans-cinnamate dioxygenase ferredoxin reductase component
MKHYKYLIIGGGLAGDGATQGIREIDTDGSIGLLSMESDPPYMRPDLSKKLWKGKPLDEIWRKTEERADLLLSRKVTQLDPDKKVVRDDQGEEFSYEKVLVATGGAPKHLSLGNGNIIYFRNFQDYKNLRERTERGDHFVVIGGSFIGSEIAAALTIVGEKVTMVLRSEAISDHIFPSNLAHFLNDYYRQKGVEMLTGETVTSIQQEGKVLMIKTESGRVLQANGIVAGIGIQPNLDLAKEAGLKIDDGIVVNERLETSVPDIYAAGDVANFFHSALEKRTRIEHENNAVEMGKTAGRNMAGATETYTHIPMFYSDLFDLGYEAVGEMSSKMETIADWQEEPFKKGVVYYMDDGRVRGVLLWNVWKKVDDARALLKEKGPFKKEDFIGRITG